MEQGFMLTGIFMKDFENTLPHKQAKLGEIFKGTFVNGLLCNQKI